MYVVLVALFVYYTEL